MQLSFAAVILYRISHAKFHLTSIVIGVLFVSGEAWGIEPIPHWWLKSKCGCPLDTNVSLSSNIIIIYVAYVALSQTMSKYKIKRVTYQIDSTLISN